MELKLLMPLTGLWVCQLKSGVGWAGFICHPTDDASFNREFKLHATKYPERVISLVFYAEEVDNFPNRK